MEIGINQDLSRFIGRFGIKRYIQEDLGDDQLYKVVSQGRESGEYSSYECRLLCRAMEMLPKLQFKGAEGLDWSVCYPEPAFNERMILFDLNYFKYCFLKATGLEFNEVKLQDDFERLKTDFVLRICTFLSRKLKGRCGETIFCCPAGWVATNIVGRVGRGSSPFVF